VGIVMRAESRLDLLGAFNGYFFGVEDVINGAALPDKQREKEDKEEGKRSEPEAAFVSCWCFFRKYGESLPS
jgi:hypothetical protein